MLWLSVKVLDAKTRLVKATKKFVTGQEEGASAVEYGVWSAHKANVLDLAGLRKRVGFDRRRSYETPDTPMLGLPRSGARHGRCLENLPRGR